MCLAVAEKAPTEKSLALRFCLDRTETSNEEYAVRMNRFVNNKSLQLTLREMQTMLRNPRTLGGMAVVALVLGISGPFQTFEALNIVGRLAYWTAMTFITFSVGSFFGTWATHLIEGRTRLGAFQVIPISLAVAVPIFVSVILINSAAFNDWDFSPAYLGTLALYCAVISLAVTTMFAIFKRTKPEAQTVSPPRLLQRIPVAKRGALVSLSVEDHYVAVRTIKGTEMVLMRLSDAIAETEGTNGLQIHRSHWVALEGVAAVHKRPGKLVVETISGDEMPVSRTYINAVKEAGLVT